MKHAYLLICLILASCGIEELITPLDSRQRYEKSLSDIDLAIWKKASIQALKDSININLPYQETIEIDTSSILGSGYTVTIPRGNTLKVELNSSSILVDIHRLRSDSLQRLDAIYKPNALSEFHRIEIVEWGNYVIRIQPKLKIKQTLEIKLSLEPIFLFPVANGKNADIGSFWGDPRDGGKRKHKGIDIFAKKGTPLLAVSDSKVRAVRDRGLGGKQIWLNDSKRNLNIYYAHLDSQYVQHGQQVYRGDTIGTVGNTGNARTTPPHLHFGIYEHFAGAIDPINYVQLIRNKFSEQRSVSSIAGSVLEISTVKANFRPAPSSKTKIITALNKGQKVKVIGLSGNWYHVRDANGQAGFIHKSNLSTLT